MCGIPRYKLRCLSTHEFLKFLLKKKEKERKKALKEKSQRCSEKCEEIMTA